MPLRFDEPLPPLFDPAFYRAAHPGLDLPDDAAAARHEEERGRAEGLAASPMAMREGLVAAIDLARPVLEIGPFCQPLLQGSAVEYLDRLDAAGLRARAEALGLPTGRCPERIHHLGSLDAVEAGRFEAVLSSHAIEHQPDLVRHLEAVARVLRPNGRYFLVVPDKRFCFDHFLPPSTLADVLRAWEEGRVTHHLGSVVEHAALVTHNDPSRHWRGDHGEVSGAEQARRAAEALAAHRRADGAYLDVHAWQFTPNSFADLMQGLARLGLSAFEPERVWPTVRDRAEFCAVLRRARPARRSPRRDHGRQVVLMQTADAFRYAPMLAVTQPNVAEYARRHGFGYEAFVGVKRGHHAWQATYNRIPMLLELVEAGRTGWAVYLDADAYVRDLDFDLAAYLDRHRDRAAVFATSGVTGEAWDVNAGVALVNLDHPLGRRLVRSWAERFARIPDGELAAAREWREGDNDQDLLHDLLRQEPEIAAAVHVEALALLNSGGARFIRQRLRAHFETFDARLAALKDEVAAVGAAFGSSDGVVPPEAHGRGAARLLHGIGAPAWLAEAPPGRGNATARAALAQWQTGPRTAVLAQDRAFAAALDAGDAPAVASILAGLGRSAVARGLLGGDRQHIRATEDPAFARDRVLRTQDALLSLAEASGAVAPENPDRGRWGANGRIPAPELFAGIERALGADLAPPRTIGSFLGVEVGRGLVLHLRMVEAIYTAMRVREVAALMGTPRVAEVNGGIGLAAWYARALGLSAYALAAAPVAAAVQAGVLADLVPPVPIGGRVHGPVDLLVAEDLPGLAPDDARARLQEAAGAGARALLSLAQEAAADPARPEPTAGELVTSAAGGWRRAWRARHGLKPGYMEELWLHGG